LADVLAAFGFRNLDDDPALAGTNTTTEVMARVVADRIADRIAAGELGSAHLHSLVVTLHESPVA
jgi:6-pyruvoyl-tetrahydropterin synthase